MDATFLPGPVHSLRDRFPAFAVRVTLCAASALAGLGGRAQMAGGVSSDSETPREVKAGELQAQVLSGDVDLFTGRYSASYPLGEVATPGGLGFALALQYSPTIVGSTTPMLTEGVPYGAGWDVNVPTITVSNTYRHHYTEEQERDILEHGNVCPSYPCSGLATLNGMDEMMDGEGYWYAPMVNIPGVASGRAVFQRVDRSEAVFMLNTFEQYIELRYDGSGWRALTPDGRVYVFGQAEVNVRMPSSQRALDYEEVNDYVGAADPDGLDAQLAQLKVRNSILPKEVTYSWHCITIADPLHLPGQFIRFEYRAYGEFDYYQELGQKNYNQWLYNEFFSLGDDDSAYYYFGTPFLSLARASAARDVVLQRVLATTTEGEMARLELDYAAKNSGTQDLLNAGDSLDAMYGKELVWSQGGEEDFAEWVRFRHLKSDGIPWSAAPEAVSPHDPYVSAGGQRYSVGLSAAADLPFDHGVLESPRIDEPLFPGDIYEVRTQVYNASNAPTDIGNLDINVFTGTGPAIVGESSGTGWVSDNEYNASRERVLFTTFDRAVKWNTNGGDGNTQYTSNFFLMPDIPGGTQAAHHGKAIKNYAGMTIQIGPANSDNDFSLGPKGDECPGVLDDLAWGDDSAGHHFSAYKTYDHQIWRRALGTGAPPYANVIGEPRLGNLSHHPLPHAFGVGLPWSMLLLPGHHLANAPVFDAVPWENSMFAFWWNDHSCTALTHANKPTLFPATVKLKRVEVWRYNKRSFLLKEVRTYVRNGEIGGPAATGMRLVGRTVVEHQAQVKPLFRNLEYYPRDTLQLGRYAKNVLLLTAVRQAPVDPSHDPPADLSATPAADMPSTVFAYDSAYHFVKAAPIAYDCSGIVSDHARPDILEYTWASSPLLTRIVDPLGGITTIDYNDPTDRDLTETQAFDLRVESHLDTNNVCDSWTRIDQGSITMTPTVKRILRGDETSDTARVTDYAYANKVYKPVRKSPNSHYRETRTEFEDRSYGYLTVTVTGPQNGTIGGDPVRNRTVHRFRGGQFFAYTDVDMGDYGKARLFTGTTWPADSTADGKEFLLFGKLKDSRQYDHLDRLLIEDVNTYTVSKAFDNGMLRHHWDVGRFAQTDDYVDYDTAFTARPHGVPSYLEHGMRPYADNKFLETATFAFPPEAGEYAVAYPPIYLNSYFVALTRTAHTEHDPEGCVNEEPFVAPPWPGDLDTLQNARGNGWTNLTEDPKSAVRLTALDTYGLTSTVKDDLMDGPLDEAVLQKAIDVALAADTGRLRAVLLDQYRLSDLRLLDVARKVGTFGTVFVRRVLSAQPYLSDYVLEGLFAAGLPGTVVKEQLLRQRYLSSVILDVLLDADTVLGALDQQEVLLAQGRLPRPILARLIDDTLFTDPMKAAVLVDQDLLPEAVFDSLALRLHDWDPNAIQEVVLHGPRYPDDDFLLALIDASPALPEEVVAAILSASPHAHSGDVVSAVNGKASIKERLPNLSAWEDLTTDCGAPCQSEDLAITTYTDYTYYTADSAGVTDAPGYKRLFGFGLDHAPFRLKWQPSWLLFSKKTWSPQYPSAYATDEYYYYQDLLNRYDRHWSVLQGVDGFVVAIDEDEHDPLTGLPEIIVYPSHDPEPYHVPDIEAILRLEAFGDRTSAAYQHRSITKNALDRVPLVRNEFRYYFGQWPQLPYPYNTDVVLPAGAPCPPDPVTTGGGGPGSPGHTGPGVAATYRTYGFNDANWLDQLGGVPTDYALARRRDGGFFFVPFALAKDIAAGDSLWTVYYRSWAPDSIYDPDRGTGGERLDIAELDLMKAFQLRSSHRQADSLLLAVYDTVAMFPEEVPLLQFRPTDDGNPATVDLWAPVMPYATLDEGVVLERNAFQQPQLVEDERGLRTRYVYGTKVYTWYHNPTTPCHNYQTETLYHPGRPTAIITGCGLPDSLVTRYRYNVDNSVDSLIDPNGLVLHYAYDGFGRLSRSYRNGDLLAAQQYGHWANTAAHQGDGFFTRAQQNHVSTVQYLEADSAAALVTRAYADPLGRGYNTVAWAMDVPDPDPDTLPQVPAMVSSGRTQYDAWDRVVQRYKPYVVHAGTPFDLKVTSAVLSGTPALYTTAQAEPDPRGRPLAESKVGETIGGAGHWVKHSYKFLDAGAFTCALGLSAAEAHQLMPQQPGDHVWRMAQTIDEDGRRSRAYTNALGQQVATQAFLTDSTAAVTLFLYDSQGQVARTIDPEKHVTYEARNLLGWTYLRSTRDGGITRYMYDRSGNVVLEQNAVDRLGETVYGAADTLADVPTYRRYTYDAYDRLVRQERVRAPRYGLGDRFKVGVVWKAFGSHPVPPLHYSSSLTGFEVVDGEEELTSNAVPNPFTHYTFTAGSTLDWLAVQDVLDDSRIRCTVACADLVRSPIVEKVWTYFIPPGVPLPEPLVTATQWAYLVGNRAYRRGRLDHTVTYPHRRYQDLGAELAWPEVGFTHPVAPHLFDFFNYDAAGRTAWQIQQFNPDGITIDDPGLLAVLDYSRYDLRGNLRTVNIDINADHQLDLQQHYVHDAWGRLVDVYASHRGLEAAGEHLAALAYDTATALLKRAIFYRRCKQDREDLECDRTTYSYDTRDRLRRITARFYTEWLYYDDELPQQNGSDLQGQHNWNGAINGTRHDYDFTPLPAPPAISGFSGSTWYGYRYDALGRLVRADGIVHDEVASATGPDDLRYRVGDEAFSYDRVGNLRTLQRVGRYAVNGGAQPLEQAWSYGYGAANSRLLHLTALGAPALAGGDYGYDAAGNLLTDSYRGREGTLVGRSDLPWEVVLEADTAGQRKEKYLYDVGDQRIYKQESRSYGSTVGQVEGAAWHLRDVQGRELGVLDLTEGTWAWYAFGAQRFARIRPAEELQPVFYDGDIGSDHRGQENDEYTSLAQCVAQLAGPGGRLEYPVTLVRVVLQDGTVLFLSEAAYVALDSVSSGLVAEHDVLLFEGDRDRITVLHNGDEVTMSLDEVLGGGLEGGGIAVNGNGFWYTVPRFGRTSEVTYYEHDHLGNLRVAYAVDPVCQIQEGDGAIIGLTGYRLEHVLDYYPYGKVLRQYVNASGPERYLTTQHERDQETGLDYRGARYYDSDVARFLSLDPLAADYASWSPYNYVMANPITLTDPTGKGPEGGDDQDPPLGARLLQGFMFVNGSVGKFFNQTNPVNLLTGYKTSDNPYHIDNQVAGTAGLGAMLLEGTMLMDAARGGGNNNRASNTVTKADEYVDDAPMILRRTPALVEGAETVLHSPSFLVDRSGQTFPVPKGATGPVPVINDAGKQTGIAFTGGRMGANGQVSTIRVMDPTPARGTSPGYGSGYVKYMNSRRQGVNPATGKTGANTETHFPLKAGQ